MKNPSLRRDFFALSALLGCSLLGRALLGCFALRSFLRGLSFFCCHRNVCDVSIKLDLALSREQNAFTQSVLHACTRKIYFSRANVDNFRMKKIVRVVVLKCFFKK